MRWSWRARSRPGTTSRFSAPNTIPRAITATSRGVCIGPARCGDRQQLALRVVRGHVSVSPDDRAAQTAPRHAPAGRAARAQPVEPVFELPAIARQLGIPVAATLHDYTLVCASGGQRVHRRERYVCHRSIRRGARAASPSLRSTRRPRSRARRLPAPERGCWHAALQQYAGSRRASFPARRGPLATSDLPSHRRTSTRA